MSHCNNKNENGVFIMSAYTPPTGSPAFSRPRRSPFGRLLVILIPLVLIGLIVQRVFFAGAPGGPAMGPAPVSVAQAVERESTLWHRFSGRLEAIDKAEVRPRVSGTIERIYFRDGAIVKRGQPLFLIDPEPYRAQLTLAEGQLASAEAELVTTRANSARAQKLMRANAISRNEYDTRVGAAKAAEGAVKTAQGAVDVARLNLRYTTVEAPINGRASRAELTTGNVVDAGGGGPLLTTIVSQDPLYVSFEMDEQTFLSTIRGVDAAQQSSIPVEMGLANEDGTPHSGKIDSFDNQIDTASGTIRVRTVFTNTDGTMLPGLYANVRIGSAEKAPVVLVNEQAISTDQGAKFVFVVDGEGKAQYRPVKLGGNDGVLRIVTEGVASGETIIVNGLARVRPGMPVKPEPVDMETLAALTPAPAADTPAAPQEGAK